MKKQYAVYLVLASFVIIALAAVAGSGRNTSDLPAPRRLARPSMTSNFPTPTAPSIR